MQIYSACGARHGQNEECPVTSGQPQGATVNAKRVDHIQLRTVQENESEVLLSTDHVTLCQDHSHRRPKMVEVDGTENHGRYHRFGMTCTYCPKLDALPRKTALWTCIVPEFWVTCVIGVSSFPLRVASQHRVCTSSQWVNVSLLSSGWALIVQWVCACYLPSIIGPQSIIEGQGNAGQVGGGVLKALTQVFQAPTCRPQHTTLTIQLAFVVKLFFFAQNPGLVEQTIVTFTYLLSSPCWRTAVKPTDISYNTPNICTTDCLEIHLSVFVVQTVMKSSCFSTTHSMFVGQTVTKSSCFFTTHLMFVGQTVTKSSCFFTTHLMFVGQTVMISSCFFTTQCLLDRLSWNPAVSLQHTQCLLDRLSWNPAVSLQQSQRLLDRLSRNPAVSLQHTWCLLDRLSWNPAVSLQQSQRLLDRLSRNPAVSLQHTWCLLDRLSWNPAVSLQQSQRLLDRLSRNPAVSLQHTWCLLDRLSWNPAVSLQQSQRLLDRLSRNPAVSLQHTWCLLDRLSWNPAVSLQSQRLLDRLLWIPLVFLYTKTNTCWTNCCKICLCLCCPILFHS